MIASCFFDCVAVGCWNIGGIYEKVNGDNICKLQYPAFLKTLHKFDILCLQETHVSADEALPIPEGFKAIPHCRKISSNNRYFGGFLLLIRKSISRGISIDKSFDVDTLLIKFHKSFFGLNEDRSLLFTYATPLSSCYTKSRTENILDKIETTLTNVDFIMGDLNGKTNLEHDYVSDMLDDHSPIPQGTKRDTPLSRNNTDPHPPDQQGKRILELCKNISFRILNGRTKGDLVGNLTRFPSAERESPSTIDYALSSECTTNFLKSFTVLPFDGLSDHCCISLILSANMSVETPEPEVDNLEIHPSAQKFMFDRNRMHVFKENLKDNKNFDCLRAALADPGINQSAIDTCIESLNQELLKTAEKSFRPRVARKPSKRKHVSKNWYSKECESRRKILRKCGKTLSKEPFKPANRDSFLKARAAYKKSCRNAEKLYRVALRKKLLDAENEDPKYFWSIIDKMIKWGKDKTDPADKISPKRWLNHFSKLLNDPIPNHPPPYTEPSRTFEPLLDRRITLKEVLEALRDLKNGKSPGPDGILVEFLKAFSETHGDILQNILVKVFCNHLYPMGWRVNFLKPIYKKGDQDDEGNYRGLTIGPAFAKLYSQILLKRLTKFVEEKQLLSPHQGRSTSDQTFLLQTLVDKYVKKGNKKIFAAFIDFKKAFDTVDRSILITRLKGLGISDTFLNNISAMYNDTKYSIKLNKGNLPSIDSNLGLKQGCPLSPLLFNLYIDDVGSIFTADDAPLKLHDTNISHFLYADDMILLSETEEGLQNCLNHLHKFSLEKRLEISVKKSKTMVFNKGGRFIKKYFKLNGKLLEPVQEFCYLGFEIKASGITTHAMNTLYDKANKAMRPLMVSIARFNIPVRKAIHLFHTYIAPIGLYNVENWMVLSDKRISKFHEFSIFDCNDFKIDILHRKFLRYVIGVTKSSPNISVYGDTGEIPCSLRGVRQLLNFWYRVSALPDKCLTKKALYENIKLRTNWIKTVEKFLGFFNLTGNIDNLISFKISGKSGVKAKYHEFWKKSLIVPSSRLLFYKSLKSEPAFEEYLNNEEFTNRRAIAKIRMSDHHLEIEKGRHFDMPREDRICKMCPMKQIEDEKHFLTECTFYYRYKPRYELEYTNDIELMTNSDQKTLGEYLKLAMDQRQLFKDWFSL